MESNQAIERCHWCGTDPVYVQYHDEQWGVPVTDDREMFEFLLLETFQAGLSWITILRRRQHFRLAFADFQPTVVAEYDHNKVEELMLNTGIIRNRQKIEAAINNASRTLELTEEFGSFCNYWWQWVDFKPQGNAINSPADYRSTSPLSDLISKDLKKRGFKFVGSTTIYAHLQAAGLINDHMVNCFRRPLIEKMSTTNLREVIKTNR